MVYLVDGLPDARLMALEMSYELNHTKFTREKCAMGWSHRAGKNKQQERDGWTRWCSCTQSTVSVIKVIEENGSELLKIHFDVEKKKEKMAKV